MPIGSPSRSRPAGTIIDGWPVAFHVPWNGTRPATAFSVHSAERPWNSPIRPGRATGPGWSSTSQSRRTALTRSLSSASPARTLATVEAGISEPSRAIVRVRRSSRRGSADGLEVEVSAAQVAHEHVEERRRREVGVALHDVVAERAQYLDRALEGGAHVGRDPSELAGRELRRAGDPQPPRRRAAPRRGNRPPERRRPSRRGTARRRRRDAPAGRCATCPATRRRAEPSGRGRAAA